MSTRVPVEAGAIVSSSPMGHRWLGSADLYDPTPSSGIPVLGASPALTHLPSSEALELWKPPTYLS